MALINPATKSVAVTVSGLTFSATSTSNTKLWCQLDTALAEGEYLEFSLASATQVFFGFGVAYTGSNITNSDTNTLHYYTVEGSLRGHLSQAYGASWGVGDRIGCGNKGGKLQWYKNGVGQGEVNVLAPENMFPSVFSITATSQSFSAALFVAAKDLTYLPSGFVPMGGTVQRPPRLSLSAILSTMPAALTRGFR